MRPSLARFLVDEVLRPFRENSSFGDYARAYELLTSGAKRHLDPEAVFQELYDEAIEALEEEADAGVEGAAFLD